MTLTTSSVNELLASFKFSFKSQLSSIIVHTIILFFALPFILSFILVNSNFRTTQDVLGYLEGAFPLLVTPAMIIFVLIHSALLFKYMHSKRSVDLFHAFPIRRTNLLLGRFFVGITALLIPIVINLVISYVIAVFFGADASELIGTVLRYFGNHVLYSISVFSFAMLLAVCSGTTMEMFVSGVLICAAYPLLIIISYATVNGFLPGFFSELSPTVILAFSPVIAPFWAQAYELFGYNNEMTAYTAWHSVITVVYIVLAVIVYKKRKSETAENVNSFAPVKMIIRILTTLCAGLGFGLLFSEGFDSLASFWFGVIFASAVVFVITEALYMHTLKKLLKSAKWYTACILVIVIFINIFSFGFFGWDTKTPELDDIESVSVTFPYRLKNLVEEDFEHFSYYFGGGSFYKGTNTKGDILISADPLYTSEEEIRDMLSLHYELIKLNRDTIYPYEIEPSVSNSLNTYFSYKLKDGTTFERHVPFDYIDTYESKGGDLSRIKSIIAGVANSDEYYKKKNLAYYLEPSYFDKITLSGRTTSKDVTINEAQAQELIDALLKDTKELIMAYAGFTYNEKEYYVMINLKEPVYINEGDKINLLTGYTGYAKYQNNGESFAINVECKNVMAFFEKYNIDLSSLDEEIDMKDEEKYKYDIDYNEDIEITTSFSGEY